MRLALAILLFVCGAAHAATKTWAGVEGYMVWVKIINHPIPASCAVGDNGRMAVWLTDGKYYFGLCDGEKWYSVRLKESI